MPRNSTDTWNMASIWNDRVTPRIVGASFAALCVLQLLAAPAFSAEYRLGPQDKVRLKVVEWRAGKAKYDGGDDSRGEYTVNPDGRVSFPMIGEITAEGRTSDQLARAVTAELYKRTSLMGAQEAAVEIVQYRPFYVLGDVDRPGEFAFRPGLSVLQAVGVAGGLHRPSEAGRREQITAGGTWRLRVWNCGGPTSVAPGWMPNLPNRRRSHSRPSLPTRTSEPAGRGGNDLDNPARRAAITAHGLVGTAVPVCGGDCVAGEQTGDTGEAGCPGPA